VPISGSQLVPGSQREEFSVNPLIVTISSLFGVSHGPQDPAGSQCVPQHPPHVAFPGVNRTPLTIAKRPHAAIAIHAA